MRERDAGRVLELYRAGIEEGQATFETEPPSWEAFDTGKLALHRYVAVEEASGEVVGWVAAGPTSSRAVYAGVAEHSVYVAPEERSKGVARALVEALVASTEAAGIWTVQSSVFPENTASLALHERAGFRQVGRRERIAQHHGVWRDTVLIERRSPLVD
ncbi:MULTISPECIES: GNAT family N-acetyltransferase [unclassified Streptomyces]|uniref:GNAT family N-acetyltransferase n=1 Tax=unclassified Streptomyces TaxID=2593676 RepID=UPI002DD9DC12|nr:MULTISPECIES: GNAT family N-acetyltransferase [unclassified Streptomyces]WSA97503.1 GNAT family N-acetyltransferase [Streptomyces sp. NBC_01795]WSB81931.1 GNAT family N-acetyltransferase [Streptomyces sp. NBC_01775]WSS17310.1 GNAT family N-acetyltransferase [Streptomyces sp. NBC_01186]WSS46052.1 GNAT family N-acetyltransferase [Streptomyces sp. NBC_01187]